MGDGAGDPLRHVKPAVRAIGAYTLALREARVKINQNENPWELPETLKRRVRRARAGAALVALPRVRPARAARGAGARFSGWREDGILAGNGSNEMIEALLLVTVGAGHARRDPRADVHALRADDHDPRRRAGARRGCVSPPDAAPWRLVVRRRGHRRAPAARARGRRHDPLLAQQPDRQQPAAGRDRAAVRRERLAGRGRRGLPRVRRRERGAAARAPPEPRRAAHVLEGQWRSPACASGYLLASPELVREVNKARLPYNINFFSQVGRGRRARGEGDARGDGEAAGRRARARCSRRSPACPACAAWPSRANFFILELLEADPKAVFAALLRRGVLVRDVTSYPLLSRCLRISVGSPEENDTFLHALGCGARRGRGRAPDGEGLMARGKPVPAGRRRHGARGALGEAGRARRRASLAGAVGRAQRPGRAKDARDRHRARAGARRRGPLDDRHRRRLPRPHADRARHARALRPRRALRAATCTSTPTTRSRTWASRSARRSSRRSATSAASCASATPTARSTRR